MASGTAVSTRQSLIWSFRISSMRSWRSAHAAGVPTKAVTRCIPLAGRLFWHDGRAFTCFESSPREGRHYRYYIALSGDETEGDATAPVNLATANCTTQSFTTFEQLRNPQGLLPRLLAECGDDPAIDEASIIPCIEQTRCGMAPVHRQDSGAPDVDARREGHAAARFHGDPLESARIGSANTADSELACHRPSGLKASWGVAGTPPCGRDFMFFLRSPAFANSNHGLSTR